MKPGLLLRATVASAVIMTLLLAMTAWKLPWHRPGEGQLRLSWRAKPERIEQCRAPSAEELAQLPEHMRQRLICEGSTASYRLQVHLDDRPLDSTVVRGGGLRHDRPLQVLREYALPTGAHRIQVELARREVTSDTTDGTVTRTVSESDVAIETRAGREVTERARRRLAAVPAMLALDTTVTVVPGAVLLVTFDADARSLRLRTRHAR